MTATDASQDSGKDAKPEPQVLQKLYRHDCEYGSCPQRWSKFRHLGDEADALEAEVAKVPIVRRSVNYGREKGWVIDSFTINCPHMRAILSQSLAKYQDFDPELEAWTFTPPYKPLVHRWERVQSLHQELKETSDEPAKVKAADELVKFLEPLLSPWLDAWNTTQVTKKITHGMLWQIFPPGELVTTKFWGVDTICRVTEFHSSGVTVEYVDWNGKRCGFEITKIGIPYFFGQLWVTSLPVYPLSFLDNPDEFKEKMMDRGRRFQQLRGFHYRTYSGVKITMKSEQRPVSGRVVIDAYAYYLSTNKVAPTLGSLNGEDTAEATPETSSGDRNSNASSDDGDAKDTKDTKLNEMLVAPSTAVQARNEVLTELADEHCLLTTPWLVGLDMKTKEWGRFHIDMLKEIVWNDKAYENLVLPGGEKELAWEFVESKARSNDEYDDFVPEKGRGIIILMFGPPGVGKTYTAEAVADRARVPLYSMGAGVLGTKPSDVEAALDHALELCRLWNAMLLLDEADIFLGARADDGLARNELVSIFLTKLEYYQGILFLTTNRFSSIDHAFQSRVDLFLPYHNLTPAARKQVWRNFFDHFGGNDNNNKFDVSPADLDRLSELHLNGREIKNLIKSALLLSARQDGGRVTAERLYTLADKRVRALRMLAEQEASS